MFSKIEAKLETLTTIDERLSKIKTRLENHNELKEEPDPNHNERKKERGLLISYQRWNEQVPYDQYLKSIKLDVLTFDGLLDPQLFLEWLRHINKYSTWCPLSEGRKVKFVAMNLTDHASQYWINVKAMRASRRQDPLEIWSAMKDKLKNKYVLASYYDHLLNNWQWLTEGTKSIKGYVAQLDEFLIHCNDLGTESNAQILSRFWAGLEKTWKWNFWFIESPNLKILMSWFKMLQSLVTPLGVKPKRPNLIWVSTQIDCKLRCQHPKQIAMVRVLKRTPKARALKSPPKLIL